jgi:hypothetical protein
MVFSSKPLPLSAPYTSHHVNQDNYYIAFIVLSKALEAYVPQIYILNLVLNYFYLKLLVMCFLLSLRNQSQCSKWSTHSHSCIWFRYNIYDCRCVLVGVQGYRVCCVERRLSDPGERI